MTPQLPIQYRVEFYIDSFADDPAASFESSSPFLAINVGDEIDPAIWPNPEYGRDKIAKVLAVRHLIWKIDNSHIGHSLSICVGIQNKAEWKQ